MKRIYLVDAVFALMVTLATGKVSRGDTLDVTLSQSSQTVNRGTTIVTFDATISNPSATDTIFLNADDSSTDSFSVEISHDIGSSREHSIQTCFLLAKSYLSSLS